MLFKSCLLFVATCWLALNAKAWPTNSAGLFGLFDVSQVKPGPMGQMLT